MKRSDLRGWIQTVYYISGCSLRNGLRLLTSLYLTNQRYELVLVHTVVDRRPLFSRYDRPVHGIDRDP